LVEPERLDASTVIVGAPAGARFDVTAPALAAELGEGVLVMKLNRGTFDTMPLSLITTRTVENLGALPRRVRIDDSSRASPRTPPGIPIAGSRPSAT
jgi:hypothetical protein